MKAPSIFFATLLLATGCAHHRAYHYDIRRHPLATSIPPENFDKPSRGRSAHSRFFVASFITSMSKSDWIPLESLRVLLTEKSITFCYSIVPRPGAAPGQPQAPIRYIFFTDAVKWSDDREIVLSKNCDTAPVTSH
jgi:hypothetical protein